MQLTTTTFEFISIDPISNPKPGRSVQIRSRCMKGKNKREGSRRAIRESKRANKDKQSQIGHDGEWDLSMIMVPRPVMSDLGTVHFAPGIDAEAKSILLSAFTYNVADKCKTALDRCVDLYCLESAKFGWLYSDAAFLHSVLCSRYAIHDFRAPGGGGNPGHKTMYHLQKALSLLRTKLQTDSVHLDESALQAIFNLALLAAVFGDWPAAGAHLSGMRKLVRLRGDLAFLETRPVLHFKLDRIDLVWYLSSGQKPSFVYPIASWDRITENRRPLPATMVQPPPGWDSRLVRVFQDFQSISTQVNRNRLKFAFDRPEVFQGDLNSVQSRLLSLDGQLKSPEEELIRLTMLAFMTTTFLIPGRKLPYKWVLQRMEFTYEKVKTGSKQLDVKLDFWVLIVAAFTITNTQNDWIKKSWASISRGAAWSTVKNHLMRVMWFEIIHDMIGEKTYAKLERMRLCN